MIEGIHKAGTEVGCRYRWPYFANHSDCWQRPIKGIVLALDDPRAWDKSLAFPIGATQEDVTAHVEKCINQGYLNGREVPVLYNVNGEEIIRWDYQLSPYDHELAVWERAWAYQTLKDHFPELMKPHLTGIVMEGVKAFHDGQTRDSNPHQSETDEHTVWDYGWHGASEIN